MKHYESYALYRGKKRSILDMEAIENISFVSFRKLNTLIDSGMHGVVKFRCTTGIVDRERCTWIEIIY